MEEYEEIEPKPLSRWVTIPLGIVLTPVTLLCVIGSAIILVAPNVPSSLLTISMGSLFLAGSIWVFYLTIRLIFLNPKGNSKFMPPLGLKVIALVFAAIPIISVVLGTFWEKPIIHSIMTIAYIGIVLRLWSVANHRRKNA
jgi:ABC-type microcin C transport system permease subunit YejB